MNPTQKQFSLNRVAFRKQIPISRVNDVLKIALLISALLVGHPADAAEVVCKETIYKGIAGVYNPSTSRVEFKETI